jgi:putative DNA primase/helicase
VDLETFIAGAGRKAKAGQLVRLLNIPLSKAIHFQEYQNGKQHADALKDAWQHQHGAAGREWVKWLADHQQKAKDAVRAAEARWRGLIPADYGEQVHRVGARFAILEAALLLGEVITGWDTQTSRDAIQHSFNVWVREFGTGNKEHQQIIEQCEAFLNAYGMSRFAPLDYDPRDLPIHELYGYRDKGGESDEPVLFYVLPTPFRDQLAKGFNKDTAARILSEAGMLKKSTSVKGWQIRMPRLRHLNNARPWAYALFFAPEAEPEPEQKLAREA